MPAWIRSVFWKLPTENVRVVRQSNIYFCVSTSNRFFENIRMQLDLNDFSIAYLCTTNNTVYDTGLKKPNKRIDQLDKILEKQPFLAGEKFTLADVAVASY